MIKEFLQFIKKNILVARLMRQGVFEPLSKMQTFQTAKFSAKFLLRYLDSDTFYLQKQTRLIAIAQELLTASPLYEYPLHFLPCIENKIYQNYAEMRADSKEYDRDFYNKLWEEICYKDFFKAKGLYEEGKQVFSMQNDMRLYGTMLEEINKSSCIYDIDWIRSSKEKLILNFKQKAELTDNLSKKEKKNLVLYFANLFFVEKILVEAWNGILCSQDNQIGFLSVLNTQRLSIEDINFAVEYLQKNKKAQNLHQSKIIYAFELLKFYCPQIDLFQILASFLQIHFLPKGQNEQVLLSSLNKHGVVHTFKPKIKNQSPQNLVYLLDSRRHKKDSRFKKSSSFYIILLLLAYLLLCYF